MPKSQFSDGYKAFLTVLIAARKEAKLTQTDVAERIGKRQTHISIIETGVRRLDLIEFCAFAKAMGYDPNALFARITDALPDQLEI
jgi:transcriptional regulator with XRE-family HTH domain